MAASTTVVETGDRLRATLTGREYRLGRVGSNEAIVFAPPVAGCRTFAVSLDELRADIERGAIEVLE